MAFAGLACEMPEQEPLDGPGQKDTIFEYDQPDEDTLENRYRQEKKQNE